MKFLKAILEKNQKAADEALDKMMLEKVDVAVDAMKHFATDEAISESRFKVVSRVRGGKVQRRKKVSNVKGYRFQNGKLVRMSSQEKMRRKLSQRRAAIKRRSKLASALKRRKISIRRRAAIGGAKK